MNLIQAKAVLDRSGSLCEACGAPGLEIAHLLHRKQGGRHGIMRSAIHDVRNLAFLCKPHHDELDNRRKGNRDKLMATLKAKTDWSSWATEYGVTER